MRLGKGELRIHYNVDGGTDIDLENFFCLLLKLMGYQLYASGTEMASGTRELEFEKKGHSPNGQKNIPSQAWY